MKKMMLAVGFLAVAGLATTASAEDMPGKKVFNKNGCMACHTIAKAGGKVGPALDGVGAKGKDFIKESIVEPNKTVTKGFAPNIMPQNFKDKIKGDELTQLVDYLASLK